MKTSVDLDKEKISMIKDISKDATIKELIDKALEAYLRELRQQQMHGLLGTNFFEGDYKKVRGKK